MKNYLLVVFLTIPLMINAQDTQLLKNNRNVLCEKNRINTYSEYIERNGYDQKIRSFPNKDNMRKIRPYSPQLAKSDSKGSVPFDAFMFSAGLSVPESQYLKNNNARYGVCFNGILAHFYNRFAGIMIKGYYCTDKINNDDIINYVKEKTGVTISINNTSYKPFGLMIGPSLRMPIHKFSLTGYFLMGSCRLNQPELKTTFPNGYWVKITSTYTNFLIYHEGLTGEFALTKSLILFVSGDYTSGSFKFPQSEMTESLGNIPIIIDWISKEKYRMINVNGGIGVRF